MISEIEKWEQAIDDVGALARSGDLYYLAEIGYSLDADEETILAVELLADTNFMF